MIQKNKDRNFNIFLLIAFSVSVFLFLSARVYRLTILKQINGVDLVAFNADSVDRSSISSVNRGSIFDKNGRPIAMDTTSYSLYAVIKGGEGVETIQDPDRTAKVLSQYIGMDRDRILSILLTPDVYQVEFGNAGKQLSRESKEAIEKANLPGIHFKEDKQRNYVNDYYAAHLIGFAKVNEELSQEVQVDIQEGQMGIEAMLNEELSGFDRFGTGQINSQILSGRDVYLSLDSRLQNYLDELMSQTYSTYQPEQMMAYLVDSRTGKLLAASQRPTFNLNTREGIDQEWKNFLVEEAFEPGSTIKILTLASAKEQKLYTEEETFKSGSIKVYDQIVKDYNETGWGYITFEQGLIRSSNVAMVNLVNRMGIDKWVQELEKFGFGKTSQSGLANESAGDIQFDNPVNAIMSSFGQGFSATPLQLMQAYLSVVNQGKMLKIQFIDGIGLPDNYYQKQELNQLFSAETAAYILNAMVKTVEEPYGTAQVFKNKNVKIAAKTGTAQIANPNGVGYLEGPNDYYFSVVSFFPADQPKYMLFMAMKRPRDNKYKLGAQILSEVFNPFVDNIMLVE